MGEPINTRDAMAQQADVLDFWFRELGPHDWFRGGEALDTAVRDRFGALHSLAEAGALDDWAQTPRGRVALILLLDQVSRNIHRGTARAFACDARAQALAVEGIAAGMDTNLTFDQRHFFAMPLMHAEDSALQAQSVAHFAALADHAANVLRFAQGHHDEIARFGRFAGRNAALGRTTTDAERAFLDSR
jgi:uncharacterized protein (DUF924 family)